MGVGPLTLATERARQHLDRANEVRIQRAALKRELGLGEIHIADLLAEIPEWADSMRLLDVLKALPRMGRKNANRAMRVAQASELTTLERLSDRQEELLLEHFQRQHPGIWELWGVMAQRSEDAA